MNSGARLVLDVFNCHCLLSDICSVDEREGVDICEGEGKKGLGHGLLSLPT